MAKPGQGKRKGKSFEWEVCKLLSLIWHPNDKRDDIFCPTSASGGRATTRAKKGKKTAFQHSDLSFSDPVGKPLIDLWNMECKTGYSFKNKKKKSGQKSSTRWDILDILDSRQTTPILLDFWKQTKKEARKTNRIPILFFRRNNRSACVCFTEELFESLTGYYKYYHLKNFVGIFIKIKLLKDKRLIVINLKDFLDYIALDFNSYIEKISTGEWRDGKETLKQSLKKSTCTKI